MVEQNKEDKFHQLLPDIEKVAKQLAKRYPSIGYEDIRQELCLYAWEHIDKIRTYGDDGGNPRLIFSRVGRRKCGKMLASMTVRTDEYYYSPGEVKGLLTEGALWTEHHDILGRSDLLLAFQRLTEADQDIITAAYLSQETQHGKSPFVLRRAVDRLTVHMNQIGKPDVTYV